MNDIVRNTTKALESFETRKASMECFFRFADAVRWYERRAREVNKAVMSRVIDAWVRMMCPFVPHTCEELWEGLGKEGFASSAEWPKTVPKEIDPRLERMEDVVKRTLEDMSSIIAIVRKNPKEIRIYVAPNWKHVLHNRILATAGSAKDLLLIF